MIRPEDKGLPKEEWIPQYLWKRVTKHLPLACADIIFERKDRSILYGYRIIPPYRNVWALIGGMIRYGESLKHVATRIGREYGLEFQDLYLVGVFPVAFRTRSDVSLALAATGMTGQPTVDGKEFSKMILSRTLPNGLGPNYRKMILKWRIARESRSFLSLSKIN